MITFTLACYASVAGRMVEAKEHLRHAIELDNGVRMRLEPEMGRFGLWPRSVLGFVSPACYATR
jgi:hypothetical protein